MLVATRRHAMVGYRRIALNALTLIPGVSYLPAVRSRLSARDIGTGGTNSARYCYTVWLRHLAMAAKHGLNTDPEEIAELGPGDSIGAGLAALLCGAKCYHALDVVRHANRASNAAVFDQLVTLFRTCADVPDDSEFPRVSPRLPDYRFPVHILHPARMERALAPDRVAELRQAVLGQTAGGAIRYHVPWHHPAVVQRRSLDMVFSQAALEHVDELPAAYRAMRVWLKPGGFVSHQIDFKSHGCDETWDGHWRYGDVAWRLLRGSRTWFINRAPYSEHLRLLRSSHFRVVAEQPVTREPSFPRQALAPRFRAMPESDRQTAGAYVLASLPN
ncbi:MAG TPA: methyltransferase domain-containing protein [Burkholderiales bacterium]|nr:methyltransferase domain-containing protein [Burkholderiales bacterium]